VARLNPGCARTRHGAQSRFGGPGPHVRPILIYGALTLTLLVSALLAGRHPRAYRVGIGTISVLRLLGGALVNLLALVSGDNLPWTTTALTLVLRADRRWGGTAWAQRGARNTVSASAYIT
jgi:hypothetical protein